jgi:peptide-methionine (R)-S-oxide reductase
MATTTRTTSPVAILLLLAVCIASTHGFTSGSHSVHRNRYAPSIRSSPFQPIHTNAGAVAAAKAPLKSSPDNEDNVDPEAPLKSSPDNKNNADLNRRYLTKLALRVAQVSIAVPLAVVVTRPAWAKKVSRTDGYSVQKTESEWKKQLSPKQYQILREGGTEAPFYSILESEKRSGTFECVACGTPLFESTKKFNSGTGWPSFADVLVGVQVEQVDPITANLAGAESRCGTCGGHLGDLFRDGYLYQGTPAADTGKRYCIDGAALLFRPASGGDAVSGDRQA